MVKKKPSTLILKYSEQDDCHYAFFNVDGKRKFTTMAGWAGGDVARWERDPYDPTFHNSREEWEEDDDGMPSEISENKFKNCLKRGGVPEWVIDVYIKECGFLSNKLLKKIANDSNVIVDGYNNEEPWVHVDDLYQKV